MKSQSLLAMMVWAWVSTGAVANPVTAPLSNSAQSVEDGVAAYRAGQFRKAHALLEPLAKDGNAQAQCALAMMYSSGNGVELDEYQALAWFERAAAQGYRDAEYFLAKMHEQGWGGTTPSTEEAIHWYRRCAEHGDGRCQTRLSQLHANAIPPTVAPTKTATGTGNASELPPLPTVAAAPIPPPSPATPTPAPPTPAVIPAPAPAAPAPAPVATPPSTRSTAVLLGEEWARTQPPSHYTIQVFASPRETEVRTFAQQHALGEEVAMISEMRQGQIWYELVVGSYRNKGALNKALAALPANSTPSGTWVRRFRDLHRMPHADTPGTQVPDPEHPNE